MNNRCYRLVFSKLRGMLVAVSETAIGQGKSGQGETGPAPALRSFTLFAMRYAAFAALALFGLTPVLADAQIVPSGAHAPNVISTANGLPQVNVTRPSGAGVSLNTYSQLDVSPGGAILNNSPINVNTQLAGMISGNPNFGPNDAAKIIVNQVNSNNPSVLRGYVEVAGAKTAAVVIANGSGLIVDGGGFINTSRGILTTGNPLIDGSGNLTGFNVTGGTITVQGAGLNGSNIDEVDLLARAVQANAAIYAGNTLHVVTGSNNIDYASLNPTPVAGSGAAPGASIDVSQLGGMYSNRIILVGNENGVGVANAGSIVAQAGDLTLTTSGQLVQSGKMTASGNIGISAASVQNGGTIYAQQGTTVSTPGAVQNSGVIAAQQGTGIHAGSLNSTGTLGAGVNNDGSVGHAGDLDISTTGQLSATGENVAGGSATLSGSSVNLAGSETAANGNVALNANAGDLNLAGATTSAGGAVNASAAGALINDHGSLTAGTSATLSGASLSDQGGQVSAQGPLVAQASGQINNQAGSFVSQGAMQVQGGAVGNVQGAMQSAEGLAVSGTSVDNTAGRMTSLNGDGLTVTATGQLLNAAGTTASGAQGGVIGGNGAVALQGGTVVNHGAVSAQTNLQVSGQAVDDSNGSLDATGNVNVNAGAQLLNRGGSITAGQTVAESATTLDNSAGTTQGAQVSLTATNLVNHAGTITQTGNAGPMNVAVSGTLDNSAGGTIESSSTDLKLGPATLINDDGTITHAGTGTLTLDAGNGTGSLSNAGGSIASNGQVVARAGSINNTGGKVVGQTGLTATVGGALDNTNGKLLSNANLGITSGTLNDTDGEISAGASEAIQTGSLTNNGGKLVAPNLSVTTGSTLDNSGGDIEANQLALTTANLVNHGGTITQFGTSPMSINASDTLDNSAGGTIQSNSADLSLAAATLDNDGGTITHAGTGTLTLDAGNGAGALSNAGGTIESNGQVAIQTGSLNDTSGQVIGQTGLTVMVRGALNNTNGQLLSNANLGITSGTLNDNGGEISAGASETIQTGSLTNNGGKFVAPNLSLATSGTLDNSGGDIEANQLALSATDLLNHGGTITQFGASPMAVNVSNTLDNSAGGTIQSNGADLSLAAATLDNDGGTITHAGTGTLTLEAGNSTGTLSNVNGTIESNGQVVARAGAFDNTAGTVNGQTGLTAMVRGALNNTNGQLLSNANLGITSGTLNDNGGEISAGASETIQSGSLTNNGGKFVAPNLSVTTSGTLDNSGGDIEANQLALGAANLVNHGGAITQFGASPMAVNVSNTLDNSAGGTIQSNSADLSLAAATLDNDEGTITHAGTGTLTLEAGNGTGAVSNVNGTIESNGQVVAQAGAFDNAAGTVIGQTGLTATVGSALDNTNGRLVSNASLSLASGTLNNDGGQIGAGSNETIQSGSLTNNGGSIVAPNLSVTTSGTLDNSGGDIEANQLALGATDLLNHGGTITQFGASPMTVNVSNTLDNSAGGAIQTNSTDLVLTPATLDNDGGTITHAGTGTLTLDAGNGTGWLSNAGGTIESNGQIVAQAGSFDNAAGTVIGQTRLTATVGSALDNTNGKLLSNANLSLASGTLNNDGGQIGAGANETLQTGSLTNSGGSIVAPNLSVTTSGTLDNSGGDIQANQLALGATDLLNHGGTITQFGASPMAVNVSNTLDNSNGGTIQTNSTDLTLAPATLDNDGGSILDAGSGTLTIAPGNGAGSISNAGGQIITAGQIAAQAGSLNNAGGVLAAQGNIAANLAGNVDNTQGAIRSLASLSLASSGALTNTNGQIQSGTGAGVGASDASTLAIQAASTDNTGGLISNLGTGDETVQGGSQTVNSNGVITGDGHVAVNTSALVNTQGAQVSGGSVAIQADTVDNSNGKIGSFAGPTGDVTLTTTGALTNSNGQIGAAHDLTVNAPTLTGGGAYSAGNDVAINLQGDFAPTPDLQFSAGHDLAFTLPGTFTNSATLDAVNNLDVNANDIQNSGTMMAGGTLSTHSATLENTGAMVGGSVSLDATQTLSNVGPTALIGATDSSGTLELLAPDIENRDDTTATDTQATTAIYGLGKVALAGGKDATGNYTSANLIRNQSALIQSAGDMTLDAAQVTNTRTTMTTTGLNQPVDPALLAQLGISLSGCVALYSQACSGQYVPWVDLSNASLVQTLEGLPGGVYTVPPNGGQWNSGYQYTTYTGVAVANQIASISPQAQIIAGGNLDASTVGLLQNYWSAVAAAGNIAAPVTLDQNSWQGQTAPDVQVTYSGYYHYTNYDHSIADWTLPFGDAPFVGSHPGGYTQAAPADIRTYALPSYESTFVAGGTLSGTGVSINNTAGNAGIPSLGLVPGQSLGGVNAGRVSGSAAGSTAGGASAIQGSAGSSTTGGASAIQGSARGSTTGRTSAIQGSAGGTKTGATSSVQGSAGGTGGAKPAGATSVSASTALVNPVIASATAVNVLSNLTIPQGGLFHPDTAPNAPYLIETNPAFTSQKSFISSNYYLQQLGLSPQNVEKRLGDGLYEQQLVQNQITSLTGKAVLGPYTDTQSMYQAMMATGASLAQSLNLPLGMALSPEQVAALTTNVVILQTEVVDGQSVLVPVVYLAKASQQDMSGPLIAATDIDLQNAQTFSNSGTVQASNTLSIQGQQIDNAFGALKSGGLMSLSTKGNVDLTSATVNAGSLALNAGGDLLLNTAFKTVNQVSATGATRTTTTLGPIANLTVKGNAAIQTGGNFEQNAGNLNVGGNLRLSVGGNYELGSVQTGEHQVVARANGISNTNINSTTGSSVNVGGVSAIGVGGNLTATGAKINLAGGGLIAAKGDVTLQAAKATSTVDSNSSGSDHHGSYAESTHLSDDTLSGTTLHSGNSLAIVSGNNINVTGSTVELDKGTALLAAAGNVNVGAATETHVSDTSSTGSHNGVASHKSTVDQVDQSATYADGSTISADSVAVVSGKDINVTGSNVVGTNQVSLAAQGSVNIADATNTYQDSEYHQVKESGLSGSGGLGVTIGTSEQSERYNGSSVTQSQSRSTVGAVSGDVSISAGKDVHVSGSDIVAGKAAGDVAGKTGNIAITGQNVTIDPGQDAAQSHDQQEARSGGVTVAVTGTPFDTARNLKADASSGNGFQRTQNTLTEIGASGADTPSVSVSYGHSQSSSTTDMSSVTNSGSTIRGGGNVSVTATGGAVKDANGQALDGDLSVIGSTISAGGTTSLTANRNVNLQASTDQLQQGSQSSSSSTGISLASPSLGDVARWVGGTANSGGTSPSPYNASRSASNASDAATTQTATVVSGNSVVVKSKTGDINVVGSGISGTQGVDLVAQQGAINVMAGVDTDTSHQESGSQQVGSLGSNGTATGFSVGVANSHSVQDTASQTQGTMRSQIVSGNGNVKLDANQDVTVQGSDLAAAKDLTLIGRNVNLDPGTDATQASASQSSSQFGVSVALGGAVGNAIATVNQSMNNASHAGDSRLAALDTAQAGLAAYNAYQVASGSSVGQPLIKATVSVGGGTSHSQSQSGSVANNGSTLTAGGDVKVVATGSGAKDASGQALDGDINATGTQISGQNVTLNAARDINLQSAKDTSQQTGSNSSSSASIGVGAGIGGQQNGFTLELAASGAKGNVNGNSVTNVDTTVSAANTLSMTSGRDTNLRGAEVSGNTVDANVGRDLNIASQQDTNTYNSTQTSAGFQASVCVPPICYGTTVSGTANASDARIRDNYQSVNQQSGIYAGNGGFDVQVGNHTQLDGGVIASTATPDQNTLSTQTLGYTNLQNTADYSGSSVGFSVSGAAGRSTPGGVSMSQSVRTGNSQSSAQNSAGYGPVGFGAAGTSGSASGTTYAAVSPGTITVRGDAGTGQDSTAGLSRDTANANGSVANTFNAQDVQNDMAVQQGAVQVGMQVVGDVATHEQTQAQNAELKAVQDYQTAEASGDTAGMAQAQADYQAASQQLALWGDGGSARIASHAAVAAAGAALGGGSVAGAVAGTVAGDEVGNAVGHAADNTLGGTLLANIAAGAAAGGALGGASGAMSGANGALGADLYNRQLHPQEKALAKELADQSRGQYTEQQIEDQMRIMGVSLNGVAESGAPAVLINQQPTDTGGTWLSSTTQNGTLVMTQQPAQADPKLQAYILANYNSASLGQVPSEFTYAQSGSGSANITGPFTSFNQSDFNYVRSTTADATSMISTAAGRVSSVAAAAGAITPCTVVCDGIAFGGTVVGIAADAVGQLANPNAGQYVFNGFTTIYSNYLSAAAPWATPLINEGINKINGGGVATNAQNRINAIIGANNSAGK